MTFYLYLKKRFNERSTWADISAGISAAAILPWPYNGCVAVVSFIRIFLPDGPVKPAN